MRYKARINDPCEPLEYLFNSIEGEMNQEEVDRLIAIYDRNDYQEYIDVDIKKHVYKFGRLEVTEI